MTFSFLKKINLGDCLALGAGSLMPLAFAPYSIFPIAVLSIAVLFFLWQTPQRAFWRGFLYGLGMFGVGISWVHVSFYQFGGIPWVGTIILTAAFVVGWSVVHPALLGYLLTRSKPTPLTLFLWFPAIWTLIEWQRSWLLTGFPWLSVGYSQIDSPLNGFAPLLGMYGVTWITALSASLLVYIYQTKKIVPFVMLIGLWGSGWLLSGISWTTPIGTPLKVALVQGNVPQDFKWDSDYRLVSIQRYLKLSKEHRDADIIIWPETAVPLFFHKIQKYVPDFFEQLSYGPDFLIGVPVLEKGGKYFNGVVSIGSKPGMYYKQHLVPFGEYIPLQSLLGSLLKMFEIPMSEFSAGGAQQIPISSAGHNIGVSICYEDVFGSLIRQSLPTAHLLVNVSNDAWFGDSIAPHQHLEIARMRALESGRYLLRTTNTGISAVINEKGKVIEKTPQSQLITLRSTAQSYQGSTPYVRFGDGLVLSLLVLCVLLGVRPWKFLKK